jgi:hypothetical protein
MSSPEIADGVFLRANPTNAAAVQPYRGQKAVLTEVDLAGILRRHYEDFVHPELVVTTEGGQATHWAVETVDRSRFTGQVISLGEPQRAAYLAGLFGVAEASPEPTAFLVCHPGGDVCFTVRRIAEDTYTPPYRMEI